MGVHPGVATKLLFYPMRSSTHKITENSLGDSEVGKKEGEYVRSVEVENRKLTEMEKKAYVVEQVSRPGGNVSLSFFFFFSEHIRGGLIDGRGTGFKVQNLRSRRMLIAERGVSRRRSQRFVVISWHCTTKERELPPVRHLVTTDRRTCCGTCSCRRSVRLGRGVRMRRSGGTARLTDADEPGVAQ